MDNVKSFFDQFVCIIQILMSNGLSRTILVTRYPSSYDRKIVRGKFFCVVPLEEVTHYGRSAVRIDVERDDIVS